MDEKGRWKSVTFTPLSTEIEEGEGIGRYRWFRLHMEAIVSIVSVGYHMRRP